MSAAALAIAVLAFALAARSWLKSRAAERIAVDAWRERTSGLGRCLASYAACHKCGSLGQRGDKCATCNRCGAKMGQVGCTLAAGHSGVHSSDSVVWDSGGR